MFFFFKQKTAYEMRISDWSSDVCSSDLLRFQRGPAMKVKREKTIGLLHGPPRMFEGAVMLGETLQRFPASFHPLPTGLRGLKQQQRAQRLLIMTKASLLFKTGFQSFLTCTARRGVVNCMGR